MKPEDCAVLHRLLLEQPWVAIATQGEEGPYGAMVAVAWDHDKQSFLVYLSTLSLHTRHLQRHGACCLVISQPYLSTTDDPQELARVSIECEAAPIGRDHDEFARSRQQYLARFPVAASRFDLGDFLFFRLTPRRGRLICGFGRASTVTPAEIATCWIES